MDKKNDSSIEKYQEANAKFSEAVSDFKKKKNSIFSKMRKIIKNKKIAKTMEEINNL